MYSTLAVVASVLAVAIAHGNPPASHCNTGPIECCNQVGKAGDKSISKELGLLNIVVKDVNAVVGLDCTPISVIAISHGASCDATALCCEKNYAQGLVAVGCVPVNINL